ncbi:MAG: hypothetical protein KDA25_10950, partial [Phycisphaerales bacterium]|nr:hypothetical protein [Phycisphaerales bacterium]
SAQREVKVAGACVYRAAIARPLRLLFLGGALEGLEQRVPEAMAGAPTRDTPRARTGQFDGYEIVGSLRSGGSGAKLYIARPDDARQRRGMPKRVVIKTFAFSEGSSLPQIVRESRALEAARQLGLVLDHGMDDNRFFYVMPYHAGEHLGIVARQLHGESGDDGLDGKRLARVLGYTTDLLETLATYHRGGLWHKDVKPDNIIIESGRAQLVDLGLVTPLRSAMTLTTHGTEYFRDPEMVRQALRGVKVHEVDGARFDLYAVGAVLYFILENTFPAHGALSSFTKKSPEAVRWVVRRAMADYHKRYASADAMLADIRYLSAARDPFAVKAVELPSMRNGQDDTPEPVNTPGPAVAAAFAGSPRPASPAAGDPDWTWATPPNPGTPPNTGAAPGRRPRLRVTNWWTGAYAVEDGPRGAVAAAPFEADASMHRAVRDEARDFGDEVESLRRAVADGTMTARRAAREQIKSARARAASIRRRARGARVTARHAASPAERQPTGAMLFVVLIALVGGGFFMWNVARQNETVAITHDDGIETSSENDVAAYTPPGGAMHGPLLLVNDHPQAGDDRVIERMHELVAVHERYGLPLTVRDDVADIARTMLPHSDMNAGTVLSPRLEELLDGADFGGVVFVELAPGDGEAWQRIRLSWIATDGDRDHTAPVRVVKTVTLN